MIIKIITIISTRPGYVKNKNNNNKEIIMNNIITIAITLKK